MPRSNNPYIRKEIIKITDELKSTYGIEITEVKEIDYAIQYIAKYSSNKRATLNVYFNKKKKLKFISQQMDKDTLKVIEDLFDRRDSKRIDIHKSEEKIARNSLNNIFKDSKNKDYSKVTYLYNILKKYKNDNFDFIDLLEAVREYTQYDNIDKDLRYDFNGLENLIKDNLKGVLENDR